MTAASQTSRDPHRRLRERVKRLRVALQTCAGESAKEMRHRRKEFIEASRELREVEHAERTGVAT